MTADPATPAEACSRSKALVIVMRATRALRLTARAHTPPAQSLRPATYASPVWPKAQPQRERLSQRARGSIDCRPRVAACAVNSSACPRFRDADEELQARLETNADETRIANRASLAPSDRPRGLDVRALTILHRACRALRDCRGFDFADRRSVVSRRIQALRDSLLKACRGWRSLRRRSRGQQRAMPSRPTSRSCTGSSQTSRASSTAH